MRFGIGVVIFFLGRGGYARLWDGRILGGLIAGCRGLMWGGGPFCDF